METIVKTFKASMGDKNCNHNWIYKEPTNMMFTFPTKYIQEKICECCGRKLTVANEGQALPSNEVKFSEIVRGFGNDSK